MLSISEEAVGIGAILVFLVKLRKPHILSISVCERC